MYANVWEFYTDLHRVKDKNGNIKKSTKKAEKFFLTNYLYDSSKHFPNKNYQSEATRTLFVSLFWKK